ncbi:hypothetical protein ACFYPZ_32770 [Streptomyces sp. NPDC005506]|uniref:hypothetical protein n=1 Tax=unclassified Streptomyces TaxID=2593676 RepID=UPI003693D79B
MTFADEVRNAVTARAALLVVSSAQTPQLPSIASYVGAPDDTEGTATSSGGSSPA